MTNPAIHSIQQLVAQWHRAHILLLMALLVSLVLLAYLRGSVTMLVVSGCFIGIALIAPNQRKLAFSIFLSATILSFWAIVIVTQISWFLGILMVGIAVTGLLFLFAAHTTLLLQLANQTESIIVDGALHELLSTFPELPPGTVIFGPAPKHEVLYFAGTGADGNWLAKNFFKTAAVLEAYRISLEPILDRLPKMLSMKEHQFTASSHERIAIMTRFPTP